ncbi:dolichol-phosphate mannosyltransferase subunit 3-domain-containing protein [Obelidium mucronatum]|nr:dolichol-phosphate mannosyltransferase subunit 3-domain-containing protein [Obelidium mucronatum]
MEGGTEAPISTDEHQQHGRISPAISDSSGVSENLDTEDHFTLSKELLKREKEYSRKNKEIQLKSDIVVKRAELLVKEGKEHLQKPLAHYLVDHQIPPAPQQPEKPSSQPEEVELISRAAEYAPIITPSNNTKPPPRPKSILKSAAGKQPAVQLKPKGGRSATSMDTKPPHPKPDEINTTHKNSLSTRPSSSMAKHLDSKSIPKTQSFVLGPMEDGIGLEATNRLLKAKLVVVQEEMEKVVKNQGIKDAAIAMLEEKLKFFDEERSKIAKNVQTLQAQVEKSNRSNIDLKARNEILEAERTSLRKELDGLNKERKTTENDVTSKDLRLNRALEEIDKLKQSLAKTNADSKEKIETLKKNQQNLFTDNKKLIKQKAELLSVFKKQNLLIDNLKRQKLHLEAAALLDFSEEEFYLDDIAPVLPLWLLVAFGSYSLFSIGYALVTFGDCPDAYLSLLKEITEAKTDLKRRGVQIE